MLYAPAGHRVTPVAARVVLVASFVLRLAAVAAVEVGLSGLDLGLDRFVSRSAFALCLLVHVTVAVVLGTALVGNGARAFSIPVSGRRNWTALVVLATLSALVVVGFAVVVGVAAVAIPFQMGREASVTSLGPYAHLPFNLGTMLLASATRPLVTVPLRVGYFVVFLVTFLVCIAIPLASLLWTHLRADRWSDRDFVLVLRAPIGISTLAPIVRGIPRSMRLALLSASGAGTASWDPATLGRGGFTFRRPFSTVPIYLRSDGGCERDDALALAARASAVVVDGEWDSTGLEIGIERAVPRQTPILFLRSKPSGRPLADTSGPTPSSPEPREVVEYTPRRRATRVCMVVVFVLTLAAWIALTRSVVVGIGGVVPASVAAWALVPRVRIRRSSAARIRRALGRLLWLSGATLPAASEDPQPAARGGPEPRRRLSVVGSRGEYDAFLSYSHAADAKLAPALQSALHRFAKPWWQLRALRVYRDKSSLAANPSLWPSIEAALARCRWFLLLASPEAASSHWVSREVEWWVAHRGLDTLLIVLTGGDIAWDRERGTFDALRTTALPAKLKQVQEEPLWVDLRWARMVETLSLRHSGFRASVAELAAPLHGKARDELDGEDVRQHQLTRRVAWAGVSALVLLTAVAVTTAYLAVQQRDIAVSRQFAALSAANLGVDPEASVVLALQANKVARTRQAEQALRAALPLYNGVRTLRARNEDDLNALAFSGDGSCIVTASGWSEPDAADFHANIWDARTGQLLRTLGGHKSAVLDASFSPDDRLVLTRSGEATVRLWDAKSGTLVADLPGRGKVTAASFSPDGTRVLIADDAGMASVWPVTPNGQSILLEHQDAVRDARFSPDGLSVATASGHQGLGEALASPFVEGLAVMIDGLVRMPFKMLTHHSEPLKPLDPGGRGERFVARVWDAASGKERLRIGPFMFPVTAVRFSGDGTKMAVVSSALVEVWNTRSGQRMAQLNGDTGEINDLTFSPNGRWLATASSDATASIWDADTGRLRWVLRGHRLPLSSVAFGKDGLTLVTAGYDDFAVVWDTETGQPVGELRGHTGGITGLKMSPDGHFVGTTSRDGSARLWRIPWGAFVKSLGPVRPVSGMAVSADGQRLLVREDQDRVSVWHLGTGTLIASVAGEDFGDSGVAWSADGNRVAVVFELDEPGGSIPIYDAHSGSMVNRLVGVAQHTQQLALNADGTRLGVVDEWGKVLTVWDTALGKLVMRTPFSKDVEELEFSPDGGRLLLMQPDGKGIQMRDATSGELIATIPQSKAQFSPAGDRFLAFDAGIGGRSPGPTVYDAATGRQLMVLPVRRTSFANRVLYGAFSANGDEITTINDELWAQRWGADDAHSRGDTELAPQKSRVLAVTSDGRFVALVKGRTIDLWDLRTQKRMAEFTDHARDVTAAVFAPDGSLFTAGMDGTIRKHWAESYRPLDELLNDPRAAALPHELSLKEAAQYLSE